MSFTVGLHFYNNQGAHVRHYRGNYMFNIALLCCDIRRKSVQLTCFPIEEQH
jgi:hypothetical protein